LTKKLRNKNTESIEKPSFDYSDFFFNTFVKYLVLLKHMLNEGLDFDDTCNLLDSNNSIDSGGNHMKEIKS